MAMQIDTPFKEYYNGTAWAPIIESSDKMIQMYNLMVMHLQNRDIPDTEIEAMYKRRNLQDAEGCRRRTPKNDGICGCCIIRVNVH